MKTRLARCCRLLACAALAAAGAACAQAPKTNLPIPWTAPEQFGASRREDQLVFHSRVAADGAKDRVLVGILYHQANSDDEIYWVLDRQRRPLGFVLKSLIAFRLVEEKDPSGKAQVGHRELGSFSLKEGVRKILELADGGEIELEKSWARGKVEAKPRSEPREGS